MVVFRALGAIHLTAADGRELRSILAQPKRVALLAYLALARPRSFHRRDPLLALFWPERDEARARNALRQALHFLRRSLGPDVLISRGDDEVGVDAAVLDCDVVAFEAALARGDEREALELYRGPLLDGFHLADAGHAFEEWLETERARLRDAAADAAKRLAEREAAEGDTAAAIHWARRTLAIVPDDEAMVRRLIDLLAGSGDRPGALRAFADFSRRLAELYELEPAPETVRLVERVRGGGAEGSREAAPTAAPSRPPPLTAPSVRVPAPATPASVRVPAPVFVRVAAAAAVRGARRRVSAGKLATVAVAAVVLAGAGVAVLGGRAAPATSSRTVVLGDIRGDDPGLALAVREALRVELEASPAMRVQHEAVTRATLRLMLLPPDAPLAPPNLLSLSQRTGAALAITGSAVPIGTGAQIVIRVLDAGTGEALVVLSERPETAQEVVPAVARLAAAVRVRAAGLSADDREPMPALSTRSMPALQNYALARQALVDLERTEAIRLGEAALVHDSMFALAHYLVADQLWYMDQQRHSDEHMLRALELAASLPPRERLIVRARYEQLIRDRPDSALVYWELLAGTFPEEPLAYEGMRWVHRAMGRTRAMADASAMAFALDPTWLLPYLDDQLQALMVVEGDTAAAFALARSFSDRVPDAERRAEYLRAALRGDWRSALEHSNNSPYIRHYLFVAMGRLDEAARELPGVRGMNLQHAPRALLLQTRADIEHGNLERARTLLPEALEWVVAADLSPPAYARLAERLADAAARMGDAETVDATRRLIVARDRGRNLRSYVLAMRMIDACAAFAAGDMRRAAQRAAAMRQAMYYGRSVATALMLEADALRRIGQEQRSDSIYRLVLMPNAFAEGDPETLAVLRGFANRRLRLDGSNGQVADLRPDGS